MDIGCGEFNIGKRVYPIFDSYLAVDVSDIIIEKNRANFSSPKLRFEEMNAITDTIPYADVIFMRQVFQHLGNEDIQLILDKVSLSCKVLIVTEHQPAFEFVPNIDHPSGSISNRKVDSNSGVVITSAPFSFSHSGEVPLLDYCTDIGRFLT